MSICILTSAENLILDLNPNFNYNLSMTLTPISPEGFDIANAYLQHGSSDAVARMTGIPLQVVVQTLQKPDVQRYLDGVYLDQGYRNRSKISDILDRMIESKLAEAAETEQYTKKDLFDLIELAHKMRIDEIKATRKESGTTVNVANFGENTKYGQLMDRLIGDQK